MSLTTFGLQDLIALISSQYASSAGTPANVGVGSQFGPSFRAVALAMLLLQNENLYIDSIARLSTMQDPLPTGAPNPDVDTFINAFGFFRNGPSAASGYCTFTIPSPLASQVVVPVGMIVSPAAGPQFTVAPGGTGYNASVNGYPIPAGQTSVSALVVCNANGVAGNVVAGAIDQIIIGPGGTPPTAAFSVSNPAAFTNGIGTEAGQELFNRFALYISGGGEGTPNSIMAAVAGYQTGLTYSYGDQVMSVHGGGQWNLTPNTPAWFTVVVNFANQGTISPDLAAVLAGITNALVLNVRSGGIAFNVIPPTLQTIAGAGTVYVAPGFQSTAVVAAVQAAFVNFVNGIGLNPNGNATVCSLMQTYVALAQVPGVLYIDGLTLNGNTNDITAPFGTQNVAGDVTGFTAS